MTKKQVRILVSQSFIITSKMFIQFDELAKANSIIMLCDGETNKHAEMLVHALVISAQMQSRRHNLQAMFQVPMRPESMTYRSRIGYVCEWCQPQQAS